jgi:hypothetical protein
MTARTLFIGLLFVLSGSPLLSQNETNGSFHFRMEMNRNGERIAIDTTIQMGEFGGDFGFFRMDSLFGDPFGGSMEFFSDPFRNLELMPDPGMPFGGGHDFYRPDSMPAFPSNPFEQLFPGRGNQIEEFFRNPFDRAPFDLDSLPQPADPFQFEWPEKIFEPQPKDLKKI